MNDFARFWECSWPNRKARAFEAQNVVSIHTNQPAFKKWWILQQGMGMNISVIPEATVLLCGVGLSKWSGYFAMWSWPWITGTGERLNDVLHVCRYFRDISPTGLRRANLLMIHFVHPLPNISVDIRVSLDPDDSPAGCGLVALSRPARRILTWEAGWEFPWSLNVLLAFFSKSSCNCLESMHQLLGHQWDDHFPNVRVLSTLLILA
jgi:hypothetical protein